MKVSPPLPKSTEPSPADKAVQKSANWALGTMIVSIFAALISLIADGRDAASSAELATAITTALEPAITTATTAAADERRAAVAAAETAVAVAAAARAERLLTAAERALAAAEQALAATTRLPLPLSVPRRAPRPNRPSRIPLPLRPGHQGQRVGRRAILDLKLRAEGYRATLSQIQTSIPASM
ncbi:hypothetical protein QBC47DRAFT_407590 [Echria macrotheca]|uniref:Uncharacterized protein n=1 Tax=Echria macrotheca TaxID=438768 RepID=A0AAJ0B2C1_9PEZI|nr:hypothetical protein QBC47DRAFT_407590 [Echria macrotheca]